MINHLQGTLNVGKQNKQLICKSHSLWVTLYVQCTLYTNSYNLLTLNEFAKMTVGSSMGLFDYI